MKKLLTLLSLLFALGVCAQTPSFKSFDTNYFTTNNLIIRVKTNDNSILMTVVSNQINIQISQSLTNGIGGGDSLWATNASDGSITNKNYGFPININSNAVIISALGLGSFQWANGLGILTSGGGGFFPGTVNISGNCRVDFEGTYFGNGAGITNIIFSASGLPAITPAADDALYINEDDGVLFHWYAGAWH